ncbi:alpha-amylase family glycosyl hydrolase [Mycoplasma phocimorsus]|uniref:alpha-amylase family glycosyl hydrolase n=1 Tax=Mycoplasma phocimorsus TaxID=3045839 RepID=UPI0024C0CCFF|nr:alpha-amylase family glycosyl hydrolase [Mycoplasma phocimorsus]MDJ1647814.1 alpha-amylase family glycosyl hydrolase [Mycoplasma phocimorsus]
MKRYYYIQPKYFKDTSANGTGDFNGISEKIKTIKKNGVDVLIIPNNLFIYKSAIIEEIISKEMAYGSWEDFKNMIQKLKENNIKLYLEFKLSQIAEDIDSFGNLNERINIDTSSYNIQNLEIEKNESYYITKNDYTKSNDDSLESKIGILKDIWNFYLQIGISGFVLIFDQNKNLLKKGKTDNSLRALYSNVHSNLADVEIIYKISNKNYNVFKNSKNKLFDTLILDRIANLKTKNIAKVIRDILSFEDIIYNITYLNEKRIIHHYITNRICNDEIAKMLLTILLFNNKKHFLYFGDELGLNLFNKFKPPFILDVFLDNYFKEDSTKLIYPWNTNFNAGFSTSNYIKGVIENSYEFNNLKIQKNENNSVLHYFKTISNKFKKNAFQQSFNYKLKTKVSGNILELSYQTDDNKLILLANISEFIIKIKEVGADCLISSNWKLDINKDKETLNPFEVLIYTDSSYNRNSYLEH